MSPICIGPARPLILIIMLMVLQACGGGRVDAPTHALKVAQAAEEPRLMAQVEGCDANRLHDSGQVLYVVISAACPVLPHVRKLAIGYGLAGSLAQAPFTSATRGMGEVDTQPVTISGLGVRQVQLVRQGQWREVPHLGQWGPRDGAGLLALDGALYLLGGWLDGPVTNEVWKTVDLVNWQFLGYAPWPARHGAAWLVHNSRLWVIGGDLYDDVWSSVDGVTWTQESAQAPFGPRYTPNAASINGEIVVYAGQDWTPVPWCHERPDCQARGVPGVWKSYDGKTWRLALASTPWEPRALMHGSLVFQGEIYVVGGGLKVAPPNQRYTETSAEFSDIWSSNDGVQWTRRSTSLGFTPRTHASVLSTDLGCFVSDGSVGWQDNLSNELFFAADCVQFAPIAVPANLPRRHASSLAAFNGSVVLLGGPPYGDAGTSVWQYFP